MARYSPPQAYWYRRHRQGRGMGVNSPNGARDHWHPLLRDDGEGVSFDFKNGEVLIRSDLEPAKRFRGSPQQAVDAGIISFTRATTKMVVGADKKLTQIASGVIPITHDPVTGECLGYLPEPARTNLCTRSEELSDASWTKGAATIGADALAAPDGLMTADSVTVLAASAAHNAQMPAFGVTSGTSYTASAFVKMSTHRYVQLSFSSGAFSGVGYANFDLQSGTVTGTGGTLLGSGITAYSNGWYRIWIRAAATSTTASSCLLSAVDSGSATRTPTFLGTGTVFYAWGAQIEAGAYPTSYIPTTTASVTRNADVMTVALSKMPFSATAGTVIGVAWPTPDLSATTANLSAIFKDSLERIQHRSGGSGGTQIGSLVIANSVNVAQLNQNGVMSGRFKSAHAYAANDFELVSNGASGGTDVAGALPTGLTTFGIGINQVNTGQWAAPIESLVYIPRRLSAAEMIARTA